MLKAQEHRLQNELEILDRNNENHIKAQSSALHHELKELKSITWERHILYVQDVNKVREDVNLKIEELQVDMANEVVDLSHDYSTLHTKVDIIADAITNVVKWYQYLIPKIDKNAELDVQSFGKL